MASNSTKRSGGLTIDYGAFRFGIGDSSGGATVFNGASFGLPDWVPGNRLLPERIRDDLEFEVGIMLPIDTIDVKDWRPQVGIGVRVLEW